MRLTSVKPWAFAAAMVILGVAAVLAGGAAWRNTIADAGIPAGLTASWSDYWAGLLVAAILFVPLVVWPARHAERLALVALWAAKSVITLGFMIFYERHYRSLDAYGYYINGRTHAVTGFLEIENGTGNVTRFAGVVLDIVPSYHALKVVFSFVGLLGVWYLSKAAWAATGRRDARVLLAFGLFPGAGFWTSIVGKDPLVFLGLALVALAIVRLVREPSALALGPLVLGALIVLYVRPWLVALALPAVAVALVATMWKGGGRLGRAAFLASLVGAIAIAVGSLAVLFGITSAGQALPLVDTVARAWATGGSGQEPPRFETLEDALRFLPFGAFAALFRPLPGEISHVMGLAAGIESAILLALAVFVVIRWRTRHFQDPIALAALAFLLFWASFYAFVSYQNLGTAVRFRVQATPYLVALAMWVGRPASAHAATQAFAATGMGRAREGPLTILFLTNSAGIGGIETNLLRLTREFVAAGDRVVVGSSPGALLAEMEKEGAEHLALRMRPSDPQAMLHDRGVLRRFFARSSPDVIHVFSASAMLTLRAAGPRPAVSALVASPMGIVSHPDEPHWKTRGRMLATTLGADRVLAISPVIGDLARSQLLVPRPRIEDHPVVGVVLAQVVQAEERERARKELGLAPGERLVLTIGRLDPTKRHDLFIEGAAILARERSDVRFAIVGGGALEEELRAHVEREGLGSRISLLGDRRGVEKIIAAADVYVRPGILEGFIGITLLEAQSAGVPVVAFDTRDVRPAVEPGVTGLLVPPSDTRALADAIGTLLDDPALAAKIGEAGRLHFASTFAIGSVAARLRATYAGLASVGRRP